MASPNRTGVREEIPEKLRAYVKLGFGKNMVSGGEWVGDCPFCGKTNKFYANVTNGLWSCKAGHCALSGNLNVYLQEWYKLHFVENSATDEFALVQGANSEQWEALSKDRSLPVEALQDAGIVWDGYRWVLPVRNRKGHIINFRFYRPGAKMQGLPGVDTFIYGMEMLGDHEAPRPADRIYLCEGEWDAIATRLVLALAGEDGLVLAVPGAGIFKDGWAEHFAGYEVVLLYDNDDDGAVKGHRRAAEKLRNSAKRVLEVRWDEKLPEHFDMRDLYRFGGDFGSLSEMIVPFEERKTSIEKEEDEDEPIARPALAEGGRPSFESVLAVYGKYLKMTPDMEKALRVIYSVILMNDIQGEPLWIHIVSPPGTGKTELLMSASQVSTVACASRLSAHSLVSGFKMAGGEDPSLLPKLIGKTFILKDFTEVLQMPKMVKDDIFGTLRGAYDGEVSKPFGHGIVREYKGRFSMLTGVTHAIFSEQSANMGERFLNFHLVKGVGFNSSDVIYAALSNVGAEDVMKRDLQEAANSFLEYAATVEDLPKVPDHYIRKIVGICQVVAMLRANVEKDSQDRLSHRPQHEVGTRIGKQLMKLIMGLGMLNSPASVGEREYEITARVALDSCIGFNLEVVREVFLRPGQQSQELSERTGIPLTTLREQIDNLALLGVLHKDKDEPVGAGRPAIKYRLTDIFKNHWCDASLDDVISQVSSKPRIRIHRKRDKRRVLK